jgi:proteasome lid subunit RPN8/RPN11
MKCRISRKALDRCRAEARASPDAEVCGLLVGASGRIDDAIALPNCADDPTTSFRLEPNQHVRMSREFRSKGRAVVGHYHSHPRGSARPSSADAAGANDEGQYWLIVAAHETRLWISRRGAPVEGAFEEVKLEVEETIALQPRRAKANRRRGISEASTGRQAHEIL